MLNGFELHVYNRSQLYSSLEKTFGLKSNIFPDAGQTNDNEILNVENAERFVVLFLLLSVALISTAILDQKMLVAKSKL